MGVVYMQVKQQGAVLALVPNQDYEFDMSTTFRGLLSHGGADERRQGRRRRDRGIRTRTRFQFSAVHAVQCKCACAPPWLAAIRVITIVAKTMCLQMLDAKVRISLHADSACIDDTHTCIVRRVDSKVGLF